MDFNPISIEEDGHAKLQNGVANAASSARPGGRGVAGGLLSEHASFGDVLRACRNAFYYHTSWSVPYPEVPAAPLLYYPEEYKRMAESTMPLGIMHSELDAMQTGLLDSIPLAYYPLAPNALEQAREALKRAAALKRRAAATSEADAATSSSSTSAANAPDRARPLHGHLDPADAEIARIVVDPNEIQLRNLPSLTHVQRPLYTDIGLVPQEERHAARVARTQPTEAKPHDAALTTAELVRQWRLDVQASFVEALQIDSSFARFIGEIAHAKLGLDRNNVSHLRLTRALWALLYRGTTKRQQRKVWYALCHFSSVFSDVPETSTTAVAQLLHDTEAVGLPQYCTNWRPLLEDYTRAVRDYVAALAGGVDQRRENLKFHDRELDQLYMGSVYTNIELEGKLARTSADRLKNPIYPVEVVPVFPSGYQQAASLGAAAVRLHDSEELDFLAERDASLHHVVLPDAVLPKSAAARPNMLVGGCNLLVADDGDFTNVQPGATLRYSVSAENTYQSLRQDPMNTASYLFRMGQVAADAAASLGANYDGRYAIYDRVGHRDVYQKTNNTDTNILSRYVVIFTDAPAAAGASEVNAGASGGRVNCVKREREQTPACETAAGPSEPVAQVLRTE
ncbi:hypothetical protein LSCM1_04406 [Leishmania martiniquensis]|uniref:Uncharacterized protein n=1 Tax=Leishmania martiniquensis TaxID=1580590 RepID=A0A836GEZ8_9TRYP|nr:hypothetical protein LSCM1_04406 [Leishmania martiniquensis]